MNTLKTISPKRAVKELSAYVRTEDNREPYIKLDMNEYTAGFSELSGYSVLGGVPNIYPEYDATVQMLADFLSVPSRQILLTNGGVEAISVVISTFIEPGEDVAIISKPSFFFINHSLLLNGAKIKAIPVHKDLTFDTEGIEKALEQKPKLAMFSSPDNPTGSILDGKLILDWCTRFPEVLFVIDEAYSEFCNYTLLPQLANHGNLVLLRSLAKAWGLAGFRLGAIFGDERLIQYMNVVKVPYSVNAAVLSALRKMLAVPSKIKETAAATMSRKETLVEAFRARGYKVINGAGNFFIVSLGAKCLEFTKFMKGQGILVRNVTPDIKKTDDALWGMVRISPGTDDENRCLIEALDHYRKTDDA